MKRKQQEVPQETSKKLKLDHENAKPEKSVEHVCWELALATACKHNMLEQAEFCLIDRGISPNFRLDNKTPLFYAVQNDDVEMVQLLLSKGADPNAKPSYLWKASFEVASELLEFGAHPVIFNKKGLSYLEHVIKTHKKQNEWVKLVKKYMPPASSHITGICSDLLTNIFSFLPPSRLASVLMVCKDWSRVTTTYERATTLTFVNQSLLSELSRRIGCDEASLSSKAEQSLQALREKAGAVGWKRVYRDLVRHLQDVSFDYKSDGNKELIAATRCPLCLVEGSLQLETAVDADEENSTSDTATEPIIVTARCTSEGCNLFLIMEHESIASCCCCHQMLVIGKDRCNVETHFDHQHKEMYRRKKKHSPPLLGSVFVCGRCELAFYCLSCTEKEANSCKVCGAMRCSSCSNDLLECDQCERSVCGERECSTSVDGRYIYCASHFQ